MPLESLKPRSDSAIVRNMLEQIERALKAGASREDVWRTLRDEQGLKLEFGSFTKALLRARRSREREQQGVTLPVPIEPKNEVVADLDCAIQPEPGRQETVESAIQPNTMEGANVSVEKPSEPVPQAKKPHRIRTPKDFKNLRTDFSDLDDRYK